MIAEKGEVNQPAVGSFVRASIVLLVLHAFLMIYRCGQLPIAPVVPDEVIINDAAISLSRGQGYVASSLTDSKYGLDHLFAHFPPLYPYAESLAFRMFGVSAESLRYTTIVMSIASTVMLFLVLFRVCRAGLLDWSWAKLILALYCTNASLIALERMARMESMIGFLLLGSLWAIVCAATTRDEHKRWVLMTLAAVTGSLCMAVHPEAITALFLLVPLLLYAVPARWPARVAMAVLCVVVPAAVGVFAFGSQLGHAVVQFLAIARDSMATNPTSGQWFVQALRINDVSRVNRNVLLITIMFLMAVAAVAYGTVGRRLPLGSLRRRIAVCVALSGTLNILLMVLVLRMDDHRCQFMLGAMLVCVAVSLIGPARLKNWQSAVGWMVVLLQCGVMAFYLSPRSNRVADMNPDRYMEVVRQVAAGKSVVATPGLWLDLQEERRPFSLILNGLDGEAAWAKQGGDPFARFDVVILENYYAKDKPWWRAEAQAGRTMKSYTVGSVVVDVYSR
jgi:hypothetical protein